MKNVNYVREILNATGISPERVRMLYCSAAEGQRFQQEITKISDSIEKLGSNPLKKSAPDIEDEGQKTSAKKTSKKTE